MSWRCTIFGHNFYKAQPTYEEFPGYWARGCRRCPFVERLEHAEVDEIVRGLPRAVCAHPPVRDACALDDGRDSHCREACYFAQRHSDGYMTVGELLSRLQGVPDGTPIYYQRIEDSYFTKHGWKTRTLDWEPNNPDEFIRAWSAHYDEKEKAFCINGHY